MNKLNTGIYKLENMINGKVYIGQSINIPRRILEHKRAAELTSTLLIHKVIRKYGWDNFKVSVVENLLPNELNEREVYWISQYQSYNKDKGYNIDFGGNSGRRTTDKLFNKLDNIYIDLKKGIPVKKIAIKYDTTSANISYINNGKIWVSEDMSYPVHNYRPNRHATKLKKYCDTCGIEIHYTANKCIKCNNTLRSKRPSKKELYRAIINNDFNLTKTSLIWGVSGNTVKKWCNIYGVNYKKEKVSKVKNLNNLPKEVVMMSKEDKQVLKEFKNIKSAARYVDGHSSHISDVCKGRRKSAYGFIWKFI